MLHSPKLTCVKRLVQRIPAWVLYTFLRLVFLVVPLLICWLVLGIPLWLSAIFAAMIALALSVLLLTNMRHRMASSMERSRETNRKKTVTDEEHEDAL